jgi:hypothetical protein
MGLPVTTAPPSDAQDTTLTEPVAERIEAQMIGAREVRFRTHDVQPPAFLYVTQDDGLYALVANVQTGLVLNLTATVLLPDGRVQANAWSISPAADGAQHAYLFPLAESFLLNVSVQPASGVRYGQAWIFVCVRRGGMASGVNLQTLISSTVDSFGGPTWPGGGIRQSVDGPGLIVTQFSVGTVLGQGFAFNVPTFARIMLRAIFAIFQAGATVATRYYQLYMYDSGGNMCYQDMAEPTITANGSLGIGWGLKSGFAQAAAVQGNMTRSLPELILMPGAQINLGAVNITPTDKFAYITWNYEQWFSF